VPTILVVDDEPMVLRLMELILEEEGFTVLSAEDGLDAIRVSQSHQGVIDLLVSDLSMPRMDGQSLATALLAADPGLPVLFISGYCEEAPGRQNKSIKFLPKPFSPLTLADAVRGMLTEAAEPKAKPI
jgi:two-component system, cell cycle sensor histidine kinase and response regulator CckA